MSTDHVELKQLAVRRDTVLRRMQALRAEISAIDEKLSIEQRDLNAIDRQLMKLKEKNKAIMISEHAILRYLERVAGVDIEAVKREMMPSAVVKMIRAMGPGEYPVGTHMVKVKDNTVVTILIKEAKPKPAREPREEDPVFPVGPGILICPKCRESVERVLKNGQCALCNQEAFGGEE